MILLGIGLAVVLVVAVVVIAVCAVRACRILARMVELCDKIAGLCGKLHLQLSNIIRAMPKDFDLTEIYRRGR